MEFLGKTVIAHVGVRQLTGKDLQVLLLVGYDESNDTYRGICFPHSQLFAATVKALPKGQFEAGPNIRATFPQEVQGLSRYPNAKRPDAAFQFVLPGEDMSGIDAIAAAGAAPRPAEPIGEDQSSTTESNVGQSQANIDAAQVVSRPDDFVAQQAPAAADVQRRRPAPGSDRERKAAGADGFLTEKDVVSWNLKNPNKKIDWQEVLRRPE